MSIGTVLTHLLITPLYQQPLCVCMSSAVDELYYLCEEDSDVDRAKEVVQLLNRSKIDFEKVNPTYAIRHQLFIPVYIDFIIKLVERIDLQAKFEQDPMRGVEWEVRKTNVGQPPVILEERLSSDVNGAVSSLDMAPKQEEESPPAYRRPPSLSLKLLEIDGATQAEGIQDALIGCSCDKGEVMVFFLIERESKPGGIA